MSDRFEDIKQMYDMELASDDPNSPAVWLIKEVERLRAARIADLEEIISLGHHLGATEHVQKSKHTDADKITWKAHKLAWGLRFSYNNGEKCPDCEGFRWNHG
jgi:hypothetical protein